MTDLEKFGWGVDFAVLTKRVLRTHQPAEGRSFEEVLHPRKIF